ncbi:MAG TPA: carbonic anhydrase [Candidatus Limnocylindrales bacterium]|nr:carbonic anhydrase [Candidatus Limnocylindrales bacterium]
MSAEYERILSENLRYTESFDRSALTAAPLSGIAVVACMDARLDVEEALGLRTGDAHIIRNAGGLATEDVVRSLIVSQQLLGTDEIVVIGHTGCGLLDADEDDLRARLSAQSGQPADVAFGSFDDLDASVRRQVETLRGHPWLKRVPVHGLVFEVETGRLYEVA